MPGPRLGIWIYEELVRVEPQSVLGFIRTMNSIAVNRARARVGDKAVPHLIGVFGQVDPVEFSDTLIVEKAKLYSCRCGGKQREIYSKTRPRRAQWMRRTFPQATADDGGHLVG